MAFQGGERHIPQCYNIITVSIHVKVCGCPFKACVLNCNLLTSCLICALLKCTSVWSHYFITSLCVLLFESLSVNKAVLSDSQNSGALEPSVEATALSAGSRPGRI